MLRSIIGKAIEGNTHILILDRHIHKASDYTRHGQAIRGLQQKHVPTMLTAGWIREIRQVKSTSVLDSYTESPPISRTRSLY